MPEESEGLTETLRAELLSGFVYDGEICSWIWRIVTLINGRPSNIRVSGERAGRPEALSDMELVWRALSGPEPTGRTILFETGRDHLDW